METEIIVVNEKNSDIKSLAEKIEFPIDLAGNVNELEKLLEARKSKIVLIDNADNQEISSFIANVAQVEVAIIRVTDYHQFLENDKAIQKKIHCIYNGNQTIYLAFKRHNLIKETPEKEENNLKVQELESKSVEKTEQIIKRIYKDFALSVREYAFKAVKHPMEVQFLGEVADLIHNLLDYSGGQPYLIDELIEYIEFIEHYNFKEIDEKLERIYEAECSYLLFELPVLTEF